MSNKPLEYSKVITQYKVTIPVEIRKFLNLAIGNYVIFNCNDGDESVTISKSK